MIDTTLDYLMSNSGGLQKEVSRIIQQELGIPEQHELLGIRKPAETATSIAFRKLVTEAIDPLKKAAGKNNDEQENGDDSDDEAMPVKRAAKLLNLAVQTVYGMTSRREIPFYKKGKRLYFKKTELLQWIEEGKKKRRTEIAKDADNYVKRKK